MNKPALTTKSSPQNFHYFVVSCYGWSANASLTTAINNLSIDGSLPKDIKANIYLVPVPADTPYTISWFEPQIKGATAIATLKVLKDSRPLLVVDIDVIVITNPKPVLIQGGE